MCSSNEVPSFGFSCIWVNVLHLSKTLSSEVHKSEPSKLYMFFEWFKCIFLPLTLETSWFWFWKFPGSFKCTGLWSPVNYAIGWASVHSRFYQVSSLFVYTVLLSRIHIFVFNIFTQFLAWESLKTCLFSFSWILEMYIWDYCSVNFAYVVLVLSDWVL